MFNIKSLVAAALLSGVAAASFAQAPAAVAPKAATAGVISPRDAASKPAVKVKKHADKQAKKTAKTAKKAATAASAAK
jgi:hypothetical protein